MGTLDDEYREQCRSVYDQIHTIDDVFALTGAERTLLLETVSEFSEVGVPFSRTLREKIDEIPPEPVTNIIGRFKNTLHRVEKDTFPADDARNHEQVILWEVIKQAHNSNGEVYMGVSLNDKRSECVWEDNPDNQIVSFQTTQKYSLFQDVLGWRLLKEVDIESCNC